jgi:hypothetical protein
VVSDEIARLVTREWLGIDELEKRMGKTDDALRDLDVATNEVAAEIDELRASIANYDSATAERLDAVSARLRGLASDPENPVPDEPEVVTDPAPGEGAEPTDPEAPQV